VTSTKPQKRRPISTRAAVYRLYDSAGGLLYVGMAYSPTARWAAHAREKQWWFLVADKTVQWYDDRPTAAEAEIAAIQDENPAWNIIHSPEIIRVDGHLVRYLPTIPPEVLDELEAERIEAETFQAEALERLRHHSAAFAASNSTTNRLALADAIVYALNSGVRPRDVDAVVPYDRNHIRRIAKRAGVPARREPTVERIPR
jgi:hypothetical protein